MKKLLKLLAVPALCLAFVAPAAAQTAGCVIDNTGPSSVNTCNLNQDNSLTVTCNNGTTVNYSNTQVANSGAATVNGNTTGGGASSGNAGNVNQFVADISAACGQVAVAPTPTPETPVAAGAGAAAPAPAPVTPAAPVVLPKTGAQETTRNVAIAIASLAGVAAVAAIATSLYRRSALN